MSGSERPSSPRIDVLIPTHNRFELTLRSVASVIRQTFTDWRLVVVDDASGDGSADRLEERLGPTPGVVFLRMPENRGASRVRQWALDNHLTAPYVALLDSDDEWAPTKLEKQVTLADAHPEAGVVLCWHDWRHEGDTTGKIRKPAVTPGVPPSPTSYNNNLSTPLIRRDVLVAAGGFTYEEQSFPTCDGLDLYIRLARTTTFASVPELLVTCWDPAGARVSSANTSRQGADELCAVIERERPFLTTFPDSLSLFEMRCGARLISAGEFRLGRRYIAQGVKHAPSAREKLTAVRSITPFAVKEHALRLAGRRKST